MNGIVLASIVVVGVILAIIAIIVIMGSSSTPKTIKTTETIKQKEFDFTELVKMISNPNISSSEILEILKLFNNYFRLNDEKAHDYLIFLSKCLTHKNVDKTVFQYFHNEIKNNNKKYKNELETIEMKALG